MDTEKTLQELTTVFRQVFDDESIVLTLDTTAEDIEEWDSFNHVTLIVATEAHFNIRFQSSEVEALKNVGDFVTAISRKLTR